MGPARTRAIVVVLAFSTALGVVAPAGAGATQLVLHAPSVIGFHATGVSPRVAVADLGSGLPRSDRTLLAGAQAQASAQAGHGQLVHSDALVLGSGGAAGRVLAAWRRGHHAHGASVGEGGALAIVRARRRRGSATVYVAWREGQKLGEIVLRAARTVARPDRLALQYARLADSVLSQPIPPTAWGRALAEIGAGGSISKQTALQLFAIAYRPLPGVHPPSGAATQIPSGTLAAQAILRYRSQLTSAQLAVVDGVLGLPPPGVAARAASYGDPGFTPSTGVLQALAGTWIAAYTAHLGPLPLQVVVGATTTVVPNTKPGGVTLGDALPLNAANQWGTGQKSVCRIRVTSAGLAQSTDSVGLTVAHEVFHCYQFYLRGLTNWTIPPPWITEGTADWAALSVDPVSYGVGGANLTDYITTPATILFSRSYDGVGFWGHAQDITGNLWPRIPAIITATDNETAFNDAAGSSDPFLATWGSSVVRHPMGGFAWHMFSPIVPPDLASLPLKPTNVINGTGNFSAAPYTTSQFIVNAGGSPLEHYVVQGHARLSPTRDYSDLANAWFCTSTKPCECPSGTEGTLPPTQPLPTQAALALSGDPGDGSFGFVESAKLEDFCKPKNKPGKAPKPSTGPLNCASGCGATQGDPHVQTFDGAYYDFMAAGEFTVVKSTTDGLEIQQRQQPLFDVLPIALFKGAPISVTTAIAMRAGHGVVEFDHPTGALRVRVNKRLVRPLRTGRTIQLGGGGAVTALGRQRYAVVWGDGTQADVSPAGSDGVSFVLAPTADRIGKLQGLLGNFDHNPANDFVARTGQAFAPAFTDTDQSLELPIAFAPLYGTFGNSWRITQRQSLFFYARRKSTRSYTKLGFPARAFGINLFPATKLARAGAVCKRAGVRTRVETHDCVYDVAATGDNSFAKGAATIEQLDPSAGATLPSSGPVGPGLSPIPWTELSSQTDDSSLSVPSLATTGGSVVAAYRRDRDSSIEVATFGAGATGVSGLSRVTPFTGWSLIGEPVLLPSAGGGLQLLFDGIRTTTPGDLDGTILAARNGDGSFGTPGMASSLYQALGSEAVLASDGVTPIFATAQSGDLVVNVGASNAGQIDLGSLSPGPASAPALADDASGRLWLAWSASAGNPAQSGLYMLQLDPATGQPAAGASPQLAPASSAEDNGERIALACAASCRLVYQDATGSKLLSWAPGESQPTLVIAGADQLAHPAAAYTADGRLWVSWGDGNQMRALLGSATGASGSIVNLQVPAGANSPAASTAAGVSNSLVLATTWSAAGATGAVWATVVNPPG